MLKRKSLQHCVVDLDAGLSSATLSTWFKTLMAELLHQWQELASLTATLSKAHRLSSSSAHTVGKLMQGLEDTATQGCFGLMLPHVGQKLAGEQGTLAEQFQLTHLCIFLLEVAALPDEQSTG